MRFRYGSVHRVFGNSLSACGFVVIGVTALLCVIGCALLYSASSGNLNPWASRQFLAFLLFGVIALLMRHIDIKLILQYSYHIYAASLLLLISVFMLGEMTAGVQRWVNLYYFNIQPSELMKFAIILALARYFNDVFALRGVADIKTFLKGALFPLIPIMVILYQPNLGTATAIFITSAIIFFVVGINFRVIVLGIFLITLSSPIIWNYLRDYQKKRIVTFLKLNDDALGAGYNIRQSMIAIGSGGFLGKGFMHGKQNQLNFIPAKHTDFIFATFSEEFGFIGVLVLLLLYFALIIACYITAFQSSTYYGKILSIGVGSMLFTYTVINIAMVSGLIPVVGIPLPFLSYGRSNLSINLIGIGLVLNVHANRKAEYS